MALSLAGCGTSTSGGTPTTTPTVTSTAFGYNGPPVTITYYWWGPDTRNAEMQKAITIFEQDHPNITIQGEYADWSGYWDKLSTMVAGGNAPDVFMQEDRYIGDYARRGLLADLGALGVPTSDIDASLLSAGKIDGTQVGIATGANVDAVVINPAIFQQAGVPIPDDKTWTWEDYVNIAEQIHQNIPSGDVYGTSDYTFSEVQFEIYLRQHGEDLFDANGNLAYDDKYLVEWWNRSLELQKNGGQPPADEAASLDLLDSPIAKGYAAMSITWASQTSQLAAAVGNDLQILRMPGETEFSRTGTYFKPGMYLSVSAKSAHLDAAATFIDFMINDPRVYQIFGTELGLSGNSKVRDATVPNMAPADAQAAQFTEDVAPSVVDARTVIPNGGGNAATIIQNLNEKVLFGQMTPEAAAAEFRTELQAAISG